MYIHVRTFSCFHRDFFSPLQPCKAFLSVYMVTCLDMINCWQAWQTQAAYSDGHWFDWQVRGGVNSNQKNQLEIKKREILPNEWSLSRCRAI